MKLTGEGHWSLVTLGVHCRGRVASAVSAHAVCSRDMCAACCHRAGSRDQSRLPGQAVPQHFRMSAAPDAPHDGHVPAVSPAAGTLDVTGAALSQRWRGTWGLQDPPLGQCGLFLVLVHCPVHLQAPGHWKITKWATISDALTRESLQQLGRIPPNGRSCLGNGRWGDPSLSL